jgi:hypothetical protein
VEKYYRAGQPTDDSIILRVRFARWVTKATDTHTEYAIINAFPQQQRLCRRASMLRYTYIACFVFFYETRSRVDHNICTSTDANTYIILHMRLFIL